MLKISPFRRKRRHYPPAHRQFFADLVAKTRNFSDITWLGQPIWQNVLDLWNIQETIHAVRPGLLIECGTNRGGSALFYAHLFDLMGHGRVLTIDVESMHEIVHPRIDFLVGDSAGPEILEKVDAAASATSGPVMVILDSDHHESHVGAELEAYSKYVTPGSFLLVQDGVMDVLPELAFEDGSPGPLPAIAGFLRAHPEFEEDEGRNGRFLITHHPRGWLRRKRTGEGGDA